MCKLVFLLIVSATNATGAQDVTLDIDFISETETSCHVTPNVTQIFTEGELRFHIQTPTKLNDFWCHNAEGILMYHPVNLELTESTKYHWKKKYTLALQNGPIFTSIGSKSDMESNWTCTYQIFKEGSIQQKHESTCSFQVEITDKPVVSLDIADLSPLNCNNGIKLYNYSFTDGEETFNCSCILDNPTEKEEKYTVSVRLDSSKSNRQGVIVKPGRKAYHTDVIKLNKNSKHIVISAVNTKGDGPNLRAEINLQYIPPPPKLSIASSVTLRRLNGKIYHYNFTDGETVGLNCSLKDAADFEKKYDIALYEQSVPVATSTDSKTTMHVWHNFTLNKESKNITCAAFADKKEKSSIIILLHYNPQPTQASGVNITIEGLHNNSCVQTELRNNQTCNYSYDQDRSGKQLNLRCVFGGTTQADSDWIVKFGTNSTKVTFKSNVFSEEIVEYGIPLNSENNTVTCIANKTTVAKVLTINVNIHYIPKSTTSTSTTTTTTEPATAQTIQSIETPQGNSTLPVPQSSGEEGSSSLEWLKWVLGGGVLLITICVVVGCLVMYRKKKPPPADSTYANLTKDQSNTTPTPTPRTIQKTNDGHKPNARKPNMALDNNYSEPKDSQDMSEALYADPNRFVGDSSNYAEPYVAKPNPPCDTYAEPYKSNYAEPYPCTSEGNYAELILPDSSGKEVYAKPIPKAQRKPKLKDDCNYTNVFDGQYGNTKK